MNNKNNPVKSISGDAIQKHLKEAADYIFRHRSEQRKIKQTNNILDNEE